MNSHPALLPGLRAKRGRASLDAPVPSTHGVFGAPLSAGPTLFSGMPTAVLIS